MTSKRSDDLALAGPFGGLPIPQWARLVLSLGVFPALAIWLMWVMVGGVTTSLAAIQQTLIAHQAVQVTVDTKIDAELKNHEMTNSLLRSICVNLAKNAVERRDCTR